MGPSEIHNTNAQIINSDMARIEKINENKKQFLDLLLLADESEIMIDGILRKML